jgi:hypothetical protein
LAPEFDGQGDDLALELLELTDLQLDPEIVELSRHLRCLSELGGNEYSSVSEMHNIRSRLFGYGKVTGDG